MRMRVHSVCNHRIRHQTSQLLPCAFAGCADRRAIRGRPVAGNSPSNRQIYSSIADGRSGAAPARDTIFSDTYRRTRRAECEWDVAMPRNPANNNKKAEACGDRPHPGPAGQAEPEALGRQPCFGARSANWCASAPKPRPRSPRRGNRTSGCARRSTSCRRASCFSMPKAATFSGTRNIPRSTAAAPTCSSRARGCRIRSASASSAATIRKRSAAKSEWIAERLAKLYQPGERHEQTLADGRVILIEERLTEDGGIIGLRVDITELKQREASFRLLFDSNPVPMIVCALDDERILGVNDAAVEHYGYSRAEFEKLTIRSLQAFDSEPPWAGDRSSDEQAARTWKHVRADGSLIDLAIYSRHLLYGDQPAVLLALMDITERKRAEARLAFMAQHDGLTGLAEPQPVAPADGRDPAAYAAQRREGRGAGARARQFQGGQRHARPRHRRQAAARRRQAPAIHAARGRHAGAPQLRRIRDRPERDDAARGCGAAGAPAVGGDRRSVPARRPFRRDRRHASASRWRPATATIPTSC